MIEIVSTPSDLKDWDPCGKPYLELYGETNPLLCMSHLKTVVVDDAHKQDGLASLAVYEYFWTLGVSDDQRAQPSNSLFRHDDPGAEVWLFFPRSGGWRVCEVVATVRYLRPLPQKHNLRENVAKYWESVTPALDGAARLSHELIPAPMSLPTSALFETLAKLRITSLPPVDKFEWSIERVTKRIASDVMEGVHWRLPKSLFTELGETRISGGVTVYFHPAHMQQPGIVDMGLPTYQQKPILARAILHAQKGDEYVPMEGHDASDEDEYIKLEIKPCAPQQASPSSH